MGRDPAAGPARRAPRQSTCDLGTMSGGGGSSGGGRSARYERQEQIGSGTFGHAWLVRSRASGRQYVVKEIKVTALPEQEREQSVNEVAILSQCKHVNIIRYKEAFIDQLTGSLNIVMEYADGGELLPQHRHGVC